MENNNKTKYRYIKKINKLINNKDCLFLTFFIDRKLNNLSIKQIKTLIRKYLKKEQTKYFIMLPLEFFNNQYQLKAIILKSNRKKLFEESQESFNKIKMINFKAFKYGHINGCFINKAYLKEQNRTLTEQANYFYMLGAKNQSKSNKWLFSRLREDKTFYLSAYAQE